MIHPAAPAAVAADREQTDRHIAMCQATAAWLAAHARGYKAETSPEHGAFVRAFRAWAEHASVAERQAEAEAIINAIRANGEQRQRVPT